MAESTTLLKIVQEVRRGVRYQTVSIDLVERIAIQELKKGRGSKETVKAVRSRLHQAGGAYQDKPIPYPRLREELSLLSHDLQDLEMQAFCRRVMGLHTSTRERLPVVDRIFSETLSGIAPVRSVLDLACGLNPLALPWMPLAKNATYTACDIYTDMVDFVGGFLKHVKQPGGGEMCDLLAGVPPHPVHLALLLKAIPCLEQLDKTIGGRILEGVPAEYVMVSFPATSLGGQGKGMRKNYAAHFEQLVEGKNWLVERFDFPGELVFLIHKSGG